MTTSYKSDKRSRKRTHSVLLQQIEPIQPTADRYSEIRHNLNKLNKYSAERIRQFPRDQKWPSGVGCTIADLLRQSYTLIFQIAAYNPDYNRQSGLRQMSVNLKVMAEYVRTAYELEYITPQNWQAWTRMITTIDNDVIAMAIYLQKHETTKG